MDLNGYGFYAKDAPLLPEEDLDKEVSTWTTPMLTVDACKISSRYKDKNSGRRSFCLVEDSDTPDSNHCCRTLCLDCIRLLSRVWENLMEGD